MKLFIIIKSSLAAGLYAAQACHAMYAFTQTYPRKTEEWKSSNNIVILQHDDLEGLAVSLEKMGLDLVRWCEPDLDDQLTAICAEPLARKRLANLPLAA